MDQLLSAVSAGVRIFDLGQPLEPTIPVSPNHPPFRTALMRRHGDTVRADGSSAANDLFTSGTHVGTHVDALSHVSLNDHLFGGASASEAQKGGRFATHGIEQMPPLVCRGVLLDIPRLKGVDCLEPEQAVTASDLEAAATAQGVEVREGDVVLIRTGWPKHWLDPVFFLGHDTGVPGPDSSAAHWLSEHGAVCTGAETVAFEQIIAGRGHTLLPVHVHLLVEAGINIIEMLNLTDLAAAGVSEFTFVLAPLKIVGATGSPVRPLAVVSA